MIIVTPLGLDHVSVWCSIRYSVTYEVVGKLQSGHVGIGVFKVNNNELFVLICRQ